MGVSKLELMHGAVLAKICRNDRPVSMTLIESDDDSRSAYRINDQVIYIKHSVTSRRSYRQGKTWSFTFTAEQLQELDQYLASAPVRLCLVCGSKELGKTVEIAFLDESEIRQCLDLNTNENQWMSVVIRPKHSLRVNGSHNDDNPLIVYRNRIEMWDVPGR